MVNSNVIAIFMAGVISISMILVIFHFWVFPTLIITLGGFNFVNITTEFVNGLYWLIVGIIILFSVKSIKITF